MKKLIGMMIFLASMAAFAADNAKVMQGIQQVQDARQELNAVYESVPKMLRGYLDGLRHADERLAQAELTLRDSLQDSVNGYYCMVTAQNGWRYEGRGKTETEALSVALRECGIFCNHGYMKQCDPETK